MSATKCVRRCVTDRVWHEVYQLQAVCGVCQLLGVSGDVSATGCVRRCVSFRVYQQVCQLQGVSEGVSATGVSGGVSATGVVRRVWPVRSDKLMRRKMCHLIF